MEVISGPRQSGRSTALARWVLDGQRIAGYPGWSRIVIVVDIKHHEWFTKRLLPQVAETPYGGAAAPDFYRMAFTWDDWHRGHFNRNGLEVAVDDLDRLLRERLRLTPALVSVESTPRRDGGA